MNQIIFEDKPEAADFMALRISKRLGSEQEHSLQLADQIAEEFEEEFIVTGPPGSLGLLVRRKRWVIRNDDLQLFEALLDGIAVFAAVGFFAATGVTKVAQLGALAGFVKGILKVGKQAWTKGVPLDREHFSLLYALHTHPEGLLSTELVELLLSAKDQSEANSKWTLEAVEKHLEDLKSAPSKDGTPRQLVVRSSDARWRTSGI